MFVYLLRAQQDWSLHSIPEVVQAVSKTELKPSDRYVLLEAIVNDENGEEVQIPGVRVRTQ